MEEKIKKLENKVQGLTEIIFAMYLSTDRITKFRLNKAFPILEEMEKELDKR